MPSLRNWQLLRALLFTKLAAPGEEAQTHLYDDPAFNEKLGIKRHGDTYDHDDAPLQFQGNDMTSFTSYVSAAINASEEQLKSEDDIGTEHGLSLWKSFARKMTPKVNALIEEHMDACGAHPVQLMVADGKDVWNASWPANSSRVAFSCLVDLIGDERATSSPGSVLLTTFQSLVYLNYDRIRRNSIRTSKNKATLVESLDKLYKRISNSDTLSVRDVQLMLAELQRFKKKTYLLPNACQQAGEKQAFIEGALVSLGLDPEKVMAEGRNPASIDEARKRGRAKKIDPADLADEAAVQKTINMYLDYFNRPDESFNVEHLTAGTLWSDANDGDMGVEEMKMKSTDELCSLLGFKDGRPFTWNKYRSLGNIRSAWDTSLESELAMFIDGGEDMELLTLLWHQLVGVAAMASKVWLKDESKKTFGILLADDVGVGKTAQVMAFIAFLQLVYESQVQDVALPALLDGLPSFMGRGKVPNAPHAIIVPNSLIDQWRRELKVFFKPNVIDIFVLPTQAAKLQKFFQEDKDGSWMRSRHEKIRRIVLIPHSVFCSLTGMSYFTDRKGRQDTCVDDQRALKQQAADFFQMEWCTTWIDEAHEFRTISRGFVGAVQLRHKTHMTNACTATPLYTKPEDTINMGRIIGVPGLTMEPGKTFERDGKRHIQRITRSITADDLRDIRAAQEKRLLGHDVPLPDSRKRLADAKVFWVQHIQRLYDGHLIRRDKNSKRPDGSKINDLQPYDMHRIPVTLQDWEIEILSNSMGDVMRSKSDGSLGDITSEKFYIYYRLNVVYPVGISDEEKKEFPSFKSIEDWNARPGSKLGMLIKLLQHLLSDDNVDHPTVENEGVVFPLQEPPASPSRSRKILVYYEYPTSNPTIVSAMNVHGIKPYVINGAIGPKKRDGVVQEFIRGTDVDRRVLLFSRVGAAGLNLACADVVILYDTVWSDQATTQIIGRAHRLGQTQKVHVYQILAVGTTDVIITSLALEKNAMLQALLSKSKEILPTLDEFFDGPMDDPNEGEGVVEPGTEDAGAKKKARGRRKGGKKGKGRATEPSGTDTAEVALPPPAEATQPSGTSTAEAALPPPAEGAQPSTTNTAETTLPQPAEGVQPSRTDTTEAALPRPAEGVWGEKGKGRATEPSGTDTAEAPLPPPMEGVQPSGLDTRDALSPTPSEDAPGEDASQQDFRMEDWSRDESSFINYDEYEDESMPPPSPMCSSGSSIPHSRSSSVCGSTENIEVDNPERPTTPVRIDTEASRKRLLMSPSSMRSERPYVRRKARDFTYVPDAPTEEDNPTVATTVNQQRLLGNVNRRGRSRGRGHR